MALTGVAHHPAVELEWCQVFTVIKAVKRFFRSGELDCEDVKDLSSAYIEDDLKPDRRSAFQAHLSKCGPCQAFVGTLSSTIGVLGRLPGIAAPSNLKQSLLERTRREN